MPSTPAPAEHGTSETIHTNQRSLRRNSLELPPGGDCSVASRVWGGIVPTLAAGLLPWLVAAGAHAGAVPDGRSLAPVDSEAFRQSYGQEALFRLRLGVDAARDDGAPCGTGVSAWSESTQGRLYQQKLAEGLPYAAGQALGSWQLQQRRCTSPGSQGAAPP